MNTIYYTRNNEGVIHDHFESIESALEYFLADDGYRLDIQLPNHSIVYIYRDSFDEKSGPYNVAVSKVLYYNNNQVEDNVIKVLFGNSKV